MKLGLTPLCNVNVTLAALRLMPPVPSAPSAVATTVPLLMVRPPLNVFATLKVSEDVPSLMICPAPVIAELLKFVP